MSLQLNNLEKNIASKLYKNCRIVVLCFISLKTKLLIWVDRILKEKG